MVDNKFTIIISKEHLDNRFLLDCLYSILLIKKCEIKVCIINSLEEGEPLTQYINQFESYYPIEIFEPTTEGLSQIKKLNLALSQVDSEYCMVIEDTTLILPDFNFAIDKLKLEREVSFVYGNIKSSFINKINFENYTFDKKLVRNDSLLNRFDLVFNPLITLESCIFRSASLKNIKFNNDFHVYKNWNFINSILLSNDIQFSHIEKFTVDKLVIENDRKLELNEIAAKEKELIYELVYERGITLKGDELKTLKQNFESLKLSSAQNDVVVNIKKNFKSIVKRIIKK